MKKQITTKYLQSIEACQEGIDWVADYDEKETFAVLKHLIKDDKLDYANWLICRVFDRKQKIQYAIYAAEQVIDIFEKKYPKDKRPREAIQAAKRYLKDPNKKNKDASASAAYSAASAAYSAAYSAASASARASASAAYSASARASAASAYSAYSASATAKKKLRLKILNYGIKLLKK